MNNLTIRDAKIIFKNFAGKPSQFSPEGRRSFSVVVNEELANALKQDGWNVKPLKKRDENDPQNYHLPVAVFYGNYPPNVVMISGNSKIPLDESTIQTIDYAEIKRIDLTIRPRTYEVGGRSGVKAYLKTMYVTIEEDELDAEYAVIGEEPFDEEDMPF